ncbi:MAG: hypothetical protein WC313_09115 [Candidatus Kapaibacterium sp.]|nr:hypothetical protein [Candidatus Kapabacteria bacterium]
MHIDDNFRVACPELDSVNEGEVYFTPDYQQRPKARYLIDYIEVRYEV